MTKELKERFKLENPQIELLEAENAMADASIVAEGIANSLERFGTARFKGIGHKAMTDIMSAGARGVEILISGKVPSSRAKTWRFSKEVWRHRCLWSQHSILNSKTEDWHRRHPGKDHAIDNKAS